jgi:hypothetical protein
MGRSASLVTATAGGLDGTVDDRNSRNIIMRRTVIRAGRFHEFDRAMRRLGAQPPETRTFLNFQDGWCGQLPSLYVRVWTQKEVADVVSGRFMSCDAEETPAELVVQEQARTPRRL